MSTLVQFPFLKLHGLGNDFILVDLRYPRQHPDGSGLAGDLWRADQSPTLWQPAVPQYKFPRLPLSPEEARALCDRHKGIGADGVIFALPPPPQIGFGLDHNATRVADHCSMRIFNSDGSEAAMCGNGVRCLATFLALVDLSKRWMDLRMSEVQDQTEAKAMDGSGSEDTNRAVLLKQLQPYIVRCTSKQCSVCDEYASQSLREPAPNGPGWLYDIDTAAGPKPCIVQFYACETIPRFPTLAADLETAYQARGTSRDLFEYLRVWAMHLSIAHVVVNLAPPSVDIERTRVSDVIRYQEIVPPSEVPTCSSLLVSLGFVLTEQQITNIVDELRPVLFSEELRLRATLILKSAYFSCISMGNLHIPVWIRGSETHSAETMWEWLTENDRYLFRCVGCFLSEKWREHHLDRSAVLTSDSALVTPDGVNVELFIQREVEWDAAKCHLEGKLISATWERGCGPTLACGTGGAATAAAWSLLTRILSQDATMKQSKGEWTSQIEVTLEGGPLQFQWIVPAIVRRHDPLGDYSQTQGAWTVIERDVPVESGYRDQNLSTNSGRLPSFVAITMIGPSEATLAGYTWVRRQR